MPFTFNVVFTVGTSKSRRFVLFYLVYYCCCCYFIHFKLDIHLLNKRFFTNFFRFFLLRVRVFMYEKSVCWYVWMFCFCDKEAALCINMCVCWYIFCCCLVYYCCCCFWLSHGVFILFGIFVYMYVSINVCMCV